MIKKGILHGDFLKVMVLVGVVVGFFAETKMKAESVMSGNDTKIRAFLPKPKEISDESKSIDFVNITALRIVSSDMTDATLKSVIDACPAIEELILTDCADLTVEGYRGLTESKVLAYLTLHWCSNISPEILQALATLKNLKELVFDECSQVSQSDVRQLQASLPGCTIRFTPSN